MKNVKDEVKDKKQLNNSVEEHNLSFEIENKSLKINYCNTSLITIKFYQIDLEILFSMKPFIKQVY